MNLDNKCQDCGVSLSKFNLRLDPEKRPSRCHHCAAILRMASRDPREKTSILVAAAKALLKEATKDGREKYPEDPWPTISEAEHMEHAIQHMISFMQGNHSEDHRAHALWRLTAAQVVSTYGSKTTKPHPESLAKFIPRIQDGLLEPNPNPDTFTY